MAVAVDVKDSGGEIGWSLVSHRGSGMGMQIIGCRKKREIRAFLFFNSGTARCKSPLEKAES